MGATNPTKSFLRGTQVVMTATWAPLLLFSLTATCQASYYQGGVGDLLNKRGSFIIHSPANGKPRYTSLVRRNFLRFGKRSYGAFPPLASSGERERGDDEMEEGELLPPFEEEQHEPHLVVEDPVKRARNFIRFGRAPARPPALALGEEIKDVRERRAGGTRRRMSNFLRFGRSSKCKSYPCFLLS